MIIFYKKPHQQSSKEFGEHCRIEKTINGYKVTKVFLHNEKNGIPAEPEILFNKDDFGPHDYRIAFWSQTYKKYFVRTLDEARNQISVKQLMLENLGCFAGIELVVARGGNDEFILVCYDSGYTEEEHKVVSSYKTLFDILNTFILGFYDSPAWKLLQAKKTLITDINHLSSITFMEKQLDILTGLVISLVERLPQNEQPTYLDALKNIIVTSNAYKYKGIESSLEEILQEKNKIRAIQEAYFQKRDNING